METIEIDVYDLRIALDYCIDASCWFQVEPLPDDKYLFKFKGGESHAKRLLSYIQMAYEL